MRQPELPFGKDPRRPPSTVPVSSAAADPLVWVSLPRRSLDHAKPPAFRVLPMKLQLGDRLSDERAEWQVIGRPYTTAAGKTAHVRGKRVGSEVTMIRVWGA